MTMYKTLLTFLAVALFVGTGLAQNFVSPAGAFSHKKTAYITMQDGTELTGQVVATWVGGTKVYDRDAAFLSTDAAGQEATFDRAG